jgi:hypothetical protein
MANDMAAVHINFTRHLNSIYLQAPNIPPNERPGFIRYMKAWTGALVAHHSHEELHLFPRIERECRAPGFLHKNVDEHHAFEKQLHDLSDYVEQLMLDPDSYDDLKIHRLADDLAQLLLPHLNHEVTALANIPDILPPGLKPDDLDMPLMVKEESAKAISSFTFLQLGSFMCNHDRSFANGQFASFPPIPFPVSVFLSHVIPWWQDPILKFGSCTGAGVPKELLYAPVK